MTRTTYDDVTAASFKAAREVPRDGLGAWEEAVRRHLNPVRGMTVVDIGAGTGAFATAFCDWYAVKVMAVEPSAAMRALIPRRTDIEVLEGHGASLPLPDAGVDAAWLSTVTHHVPDLVAAAREIRRVLRPGAPVLIRNAFAGRYDRLRIVRWFPETARLLDTYPSVEDTCEAFAAAGFAPDALEPVPQADLKSLAELLDRVDVLRTADTLMRSLTDEEFARGKERLREAVLAGGVPGDADLTSSLDLLVLR
ncbi:MULTISPECIES: methyltransferase domain-containing protein [unclassified Streptomyces]|uniref:class I SAM-dependent methyltransferase n=1 Tax=unclassified Streptomyces TaxID=2593676 RepID=UPI002E0DE008|nr:methyltransferase domain-containing protein [Streptomyces sp. NBC_01205]